ncbi:MAG TPA: hypothetical protein PKA98_01280 [Acidimicrobiales bacterium]|nr:hypothetical protein [Acidimicrobiales bacterium]
MSRRIDIELTSERPDGVWTWRAAGAKQPKGELDGTLLFSGAKVGDVVRADADFDIDGITVTGVLPPKGTRPEPERIEVIGSPTKLEPVTTTLARKGKGDRDRGRGGRRDRDGDRGDRRDRGDRGPRGREDRPDRERRERKPRDEGEGGRRPPRPPRPEPEPKPKPKRLKAGRAHRNAVLADLAPEQRPIAEQVLKGGIPAVRQAVGKQNETLTAEGKPPVKAEPLVALAEQMLPRLKTAEWRDKAEAALADVEELDLRDLRSVIVAADSGARDDEARALAEQLRAALNRRVEQEHAAWLAEIEANLAEGRSVRALRLSSRPPKAGAPLPPELATRLAEATAASLTSEVTQERWATVLDALAFSPVRLTVVPESLPASPNEALLAEIARLASQIPQIATVFGVEPAKSSKRPRPRPPRPDRPKKPRPPKPEGKADTQATGEAAPVEAAEAAPPAEEAPTSEAVESPVGETPAPADDAEGPSKDDAGAAPAPVEDTAPPPAPTSTTQEATEDTTSEPAAPNAEPATEPAAIDPASAEAGSTDAADADEPPADEPTPPEAVESPDEALETEA